MQFSRFVTLATGFSVTFQTVIHTFIIFDSRLFVMSGQQPNYQIYALAG